MSPQFPQAWQAMQYPPFVEQYAFAASWQALTAPAGAGGTGDGGGDGGVGAGGLGVGAGGDGPGVFGQSLSLAQDFVWSVLHCAPGPV